MRLDKFICDSSALTRSEAKHVLRQGRICVDGRVVKSGATQVANNAQVSLDDKPLILRGLRYLMLHKPVDTICSNQDELYPSVLSLLSEDKAYQMVIAGRLDADTTGLVLITDDGKWAHAITAPKRQCRKIYHVSLRDPFTAEQQQQLISGVLLHGESEPTLAAAVSVVSERQIELTITQGKYHQVKRMLAAVGNSVVGLHRQQIGEIQLDTHLAPGQWRHLTAQEIDSVAI